jgi:hypothetical protein
MQLCTFSARHFAALAMTTLLSACGTSQLAFTGDGGYGVAANNINPDLIRKVTDAPPTGTDGLHAVAALVRDSQDKCADFVKRLVVTETGFNIGLDLASTGLSALSTAFTPLSTVHALGAASSIASGSRTAIDSDVYAKASIANFAQAIQSTYYSDMKKYWTAVSKRSAADALLELPVIMQIHAECALAPAESSISSTLKVSNTGSKPAADQNTPSAGVKKTGTAPKAKAEKPTPAMEAARLTLAPGTTEEDVLQMPVPGHAIQ